MQPVSTETKATVIDALLNQQSRLDDQLEHAVDVADDEAINLVGPRLTAIENALDELQPKWRTR